jgi:type I restriction enzyme R subunit
MERDPVFYKKFSKLIDETIEAYRQGRISEAEYLQRTSEILGRVQAGKDEALPQKLHRYRDAPAYYGSIREPLVQYVVDAPELDMEDLVADVAIRMEEIIEERKIRDWTTNLDVQNQIKFAMEEYLYSVKGRYDIPLTPGDMDVILDSVIDIAKQRNRV